MNGKFMLGETAILHQNDVVTIRGQIDIVRIVGPKCILIQGEQSIPLYPKVLHIEGLCKKLLFEAPRTRTCAATERAFTIFLDSGDPDEISLDEEKYSELTEADVTMMMVEAEMKCSICKEDYIMGEKCSWLPCTHVFHGSCIRPWISQSDLCPLCRTNIIPLLA